MNGEDEDEPVVNTLLADAAKELVQLTKILTTNVHNEDFETAIETKNRITETIAAIAKLLFVIKKVDEVITITALQKEADYLLKEMTKKINGKK